ncbi:hypothetical protein HYW58_01430 [Candidatus Kaiserbacteria bacterium]|nr:hypothetical protein [Candidatus Kaiserbacteria bacterium]
MACWSSYFNITAATLSLTAAGLGTAVAVGAPEPVFTKLAIAAGIAGILASLAWLISAILGLIDCLKEDDAESNKEEIERLKQRVAELEKLVDKLKK